MLGGRGWRTVRWTRPGRWEQPQAGCEGLLGAALASCPRSLCHLQPPEVHGLSCGLCPAGEGGWAWATLRQGVAGLAAPLGLGRGREVVWQSSSASVPTKGPLLIIAWGPASYWHPVSWSRPSLAGAHTVLDSWGHTGVQQPFWPVGPDLGEQAGWALCSGGWVWLFEPAHLHGGPSRTGSWTVPWCGGLCSPSGPVHPEGREAVSLTSLVEHS